MRPPLRTRIEGGLVAEFTTCTTGLFAAFGLAPTL
jgi:hypothetical protein